MSPHEQNTFEYVAELTELYLRDEISDEQLAALERLVRDDGQALQAMRAVLQQAGTMRVVFGEQRQFAHRIGEANQNEYLALLQTLSPASDPEPVHDVGHLPSNKESPSRQDLFAAGRYLYGHYLTPRVVGTVAAAAVLILGVVLAVVLLPGSDTPPETAKAPGLTPPTTAADTNRVVATIAEQHGAVWLTNNGEGSLPGRTLLGPNQRLTLVKGFAEITTVRGAQVLVQSPATIETTDSDNAIRLHRGKLVGICETARSKGFVVHAPGVDVVDLGTRFGVEADAARGTSVLVMEGSVRAEPAETSPLAFEPVVLLQNDARRIEPETGSLAELAVEATPMFYDAAPHPYVQAVLEARPAVYWRFENDEGQIIKSEVQPDRDHLSVIGNARLTKDGVVGKAALLTNQAEPYAYFETRESIAALDALEEYTIELWYLTHERHEVEKDNSVGTLLSLFDLEQGNQFKDTTDARLVSFELGNDFWVDKPAKWWGIDRPPNWREHAVRCFPLRDLKSADKQEIYSAKQYLIGRWQHLVFVKSTDGVALYLDGQPVDQASYTPPMIGSAAVRLGRSVVDVVQEIGIDPESSFGRGYQRALRGRLDEVALYARALGPEQIKKHYALATGEALPAPID
ncbi:MAG: LamG-like jellyroll fold domain-containing protein [Planctomycetota bacterium]